MPNEPDRTPVTVTLPAFAWNPVLEAIQQHRRRLRVRSVKKPAPSGGTADLDGLRATTLVAAEGAIRLATGS